MAKKMEIKTEISSDRCKTVVLKAVTSLQGIDEVKIGENMVTVIGVVDPTQVVKKLKKSGKKGMIQTLAPHKIEEEKPKKEEPKPGDPFPPCCNGCRLGGGYNYEVFQVEEDDAPPPCVIS